MIYDICQAHYTLYNTFESLRMELSNITNKKIYRDSELLYQYGCYTIWYCIRINENIEYAFKIELNIKEEKMSIDFDDFNFADTAYWLLLKNKVEQINNQHNKGVL